MRRRALIALALLALAALIAMVWRPPESGAGLNVPADPAPAAAAAPAVGPTLAPSPPQAAQAQPPEDPSDAALLKLEAQWCEQTGALPAHDARLDEAAERLQPVVLALRRQRWQQGLRGPGASARELALADWLEASPTNPSSPINPAGRQRLLERAWQGSDPLLLVLASQRGCENESCRLELAGRWRELEPDNLAAQLAAHPTQGGDVDALLKAVASARHSRDYRAEVFALLRGLPALPSQGPLQIMDSLDRLGLALSSWHKVMSSMSQACRQPEAARAALCLAAAERLWSLAQDLYETHTALRMVAAQPAAHGPWLARAQEWQSLYQLMRETADRSLSEGWIENAVSCRGVPAAALQLEAAQIAGEWPALRRRLRDEGHDLRLLLARARSGPLGSDPLASR